MVRPPASYAWEWIADKLKDGITEMATDYVTAFPIMVGVSIGVYALVSMFNKRLAKMGVVGVFAYGALVVIV